MSQNFEFNLFKFIHFLLHSSSYSRNVSNEYSEFGARDKQHIESRRIYNGTICCRLLGTFSLRNHNNQRLLCISNEFVAPYFFRHMISTGKNVLVHSNDNLWCSNCNCRCTITHSSRDTS